MHSKFSSFSLVASFARLSNGLLTVDDVISSETYILDILNWRVHPPTPQAYLELLILLLPRTACAPFTKRSMFERIKFLLELSVTVQFFFGKKPSSIAVAAFLEVMEHEDGPNVPKQSCRTHFRYSVRSIAGIHCDSDELVEFRNAIKFVHKNARHEMNEDVMNEREITGSPVGTKISASAVTP